MELINDRSCYLLTSETEEDSIKIIKNFLSGKGLKYEFDLETLQFFFILDDVECFIDICKDISDFYIEVHVDSMRVDDLKKIVKKLNIIEESFVVKKIEIRFKVEQLDNICTAGLFYTNQDESEIIYNYFIKKFNGKISLDDEKYILIHLDEFNKIKIISENGFFMVWFFGLDFLKLFEFMFEFQKNIVCV